MTDSVVKGQLIDEWRALADDVDFLLDVDAGLDEILVLSDYDQLLLDVDALIDVEAGLSAILSATMPPSSPNHRPTSYTPEPRSLAGDRPAVHGSASSPQSLTQVLRSTRSYRWTSVQLVVAAAVLMLGVITGSSLLLLRGHESSSNAAAAVAGSGDIAPANWQPLADLLVSAPDKAVQAPDPTALFGVSARSCPHGTRTITAALDGAYSRVTARVTIGDEAAYAGLAQNVGSKVSEPGFVVDVTVAVDGVVRDFADGPSEFDIDVSGAQHVSIMLETIYPSTGSCENQTIVGLRDAKAFR